MMEIDEILENNLKCVKYTEYKELASNPNVNKIYKYYAPIKKFFNQLKSSMKIFFYQRKVTEENVQDVSPNPHDNNDH